jgi:hypothetical protein
MSVALAVRPSENESASHAVRRHHQQGPIKKTTAGHRKSKGRHETPVALAVHLSVKNSVTQAAVGYLYCSGFIANQGG